MQSNLLNNLGFLETKSSVKAQSDEEMLETLGRDNIKINGTELPSVNNRANYSKGAIYLPLDLGGGGRPFSGIRPPADPNGPPFKLFSDIPFWLTDLKTSLKAHLAPKYTNFEGKSHPLKKFLDPPRYILLYPPGIKMGAEIDFQGMSLRDGATEKWQRARGSKEGCFPGANQCVPPQSPRTSQ